MDGRRDPEEDALLESLEKLAQKTEVLTKWADEMFEYVKKFPQSEILAPFPSLICVDDCCRAPAGSEQV